MAQPLHLDVKQRINMAFENASKATAHDCIDNDEILKLRTLINEKVAVLMVGMVGDPEMIERNCRNKAWESIDLSVLCRGANAAIVREHGHYQTLMREARGGLAHAAVLMRKANQQRPELESIDEMRRVAIQRIRAKVESL